MNMFTDECVHVMDELVANCLVCIPMFMVPSPIASIIPSSRSSAIETLESF